MSARAGVAPENADYNYRGTRRPEVLALLPPLKPVLKVLEIGCGEGKFSAGLPGTVEAWGVEPDRASAEVARGSLHKVFANIYDEVESELPLDYFDLVVCNDVIEHMTDHEDFMRKIQKHMAPGAFLVGSLPNVRFYGNLFNLIVARDWHYQDAGILDRTHFRFFTFKSLRRSFESTGFDVVRLEGLNEARWPDFSPRTIVERLLRNAMIFLTFGAAHDIKYLQIGFLVTSKRG